MVDDPAVKDIHFSNRIYYEITEACNLQCIHCSDLIRTAQKTINTKTLISFHESLRNYGINQAILTGGEPFLHPDIIDILSELSKQGSVIVTTNGLILPKDKVKKVLEKNKTVIIQFSWDGARQHTFEKVRGKGTYELALGSLMELVKDGFNENIALSMTIMRANCGEVEEVLNFAVEHEIKTIHFPALLPVGRAREKWAELSVPPLEMEKLINKILSAGIELKDSITVSSNILSRISSRASHGVKADCLSNAVLKVNPDGIILPCPAASDISLGIGRIQSPDFDISSLHKSMREKYGIFNSKAGRTHINCAGCELEDICGGWFCENCGILGESILTEAAEDGCKLSRSLFKSCIEGLKSVSLIKDGA